MQILHSLSSKWVKHDVSHLAASSAARWKWTAGAENRLFWRAGCLGRTACWGRALQQAGGWERAQAWLPFSPGKATWLSSG